MIFCAHASPEKYIPFRCIKYGNHLGRNLDGIQTFAKMARLSK